MNDIMIRKLIVFLSILCLFLVAWFILNADLLNNEKSNVVVPDDTKFVLVYSTGEEVKEESEILYLNRKAELVSSNIINSASSTNAFSCNIDSGSFHFFTNEVIYFYEEGITKRLYNKDMTELYRFASDDGVDTVYDSGHILKSKKYFKYIPHGLSYENRDLGSFDLLTVYDENKVDNIRIIEGGALCVNQNTGTIYIIDNECSRKTRYEYVFYDKEKDKHVKKESMLEFKDFFEDYVRKEEVVSLGKSYVLDNRLYQIVKIGEGKGDVYLVEIAIEKDTEELSYVDAYLVAIKENENITYDVPVTHNGKTINYYSLIKPEQIVSFNTVKKTFAYINYSSDIKDSEKEWFDIRIIDDEIYMIKIDLRNNEFSLYSVTEKGKMNLIINNVMPKSSIGDNYWLSDFYMIGDC